MLNFTVCALLTAHFTASYFYWEIVLLFLSFRPRFSYLSSSSIFHDLLRAAGDFLCELRAHSTVGSTQMIFSTSPANKRQRLQLRFSQYKHFSLFILSRKLWTLGTVSAGCKKRKKKKFWHERRCTEQPGRLSRVVGWIKKVHFIKLKIKEHLQNRRKVKNTRRQAEPHHRHPRRFMFISRHL